MQDLILLLEVTCIIFYLKHFKSGNYYKIYFELIQIKNHCTLKKYIELFLGDY